ncbi:MAG: hypothetical protein K8S94_13895 [Planctomycetia bacterium]|nr:hypothetical protein [Planctomycetia bacterium]
MDEVTRTAASVCRGAAVIVAVAVTVCWTAASRAEDDRVVEEPLASQPSAEQQLVDLGANFDANLFEQQGNGWVLRGDNGGQMFGRVRVMANGRQIAPAAAAGDEPRPPESPTFARARAIAEKHLARIDEACELDDLQRRKLRLAIESDIRRFAEDVDLIRRRYAGVRVNFNDQQGQKQWQQFQQDVQQCRQRLRGLYDTGSLFAKALPTTLDERQLAGIEREASARRSFRWRDMVVSALVKMDETLGLDQAQHDLLEEILIAREPALRVDELGPQQENDHVRQMLVAMILSEGDTDRIKAAVSERQWRTLSLLMNQGKAMRSWIEQQGVLEAPRP